MVSDGQQSIRKAVEVALPQVPHGLCHFHYLREAAKPIYAADRHAKRNLKSRCEECEPLSAVLLTVMTWDLKLSEVIV